MGLFQQWLPTSARETEKNGVGEFVETGNLVALLFECEICQIFLIGPWGWKESGDVRSVDRGGVSFPNGEEIPSFSSLKSHPIVEIFHQTLLPPSVVDRFGTVVGKLSSLSVFFL